MKRSFAGILISFIFISKGAFASTTEAHPTLLPEKEPGSVMAVDANNGEPLRSGVIMNTKNKSKVLVDKRNLRLEFGPGSVAEFSENGEVILYRGSVFATSNNANRKISTANSELEFSGKAVVSYDVEELSTSVFLVEGEGEFKNPHHAEKRINFQGGQGTTMVSGGVYPSLLRSLDHFRTDEWLSGYGWSKEQRESFLRKSETTNLRKPAGEAEFSKSTEGLVEYFPVIDETKPQPQYYEQKLSAESPQQKRDIEKEVLRNPELAASIPLPNTKIQMDLDYEIIPFQRLDDKHKKTESAPSVVSRKPASAAKVKVTENYADPAVQNVLERLSRLSSHGNAERSPAAFVAPKSQAKQPVIPSVIPDNVYDYSENF